MLGNNTIEIRNLHIVV